MAIKFFKESIDLQQNELINPVIQNLTIAPLVPKEGQIFYGTSGVWDKKLMLWNGDWIDLTRRITDGDYGDVTISGDVTAITINPDVVDYSKLQKAVGDNVFLGNISGVNTDFAEITADEVTATLNIFTDTLQGLVPPSGGDPDFVLAADATWKDIGNLSPQLYDNWYATEAEILLIDPTPIVGQVNWAFDTKAAYHAVYNDARDIYDWQKVIVEYDDIMNSYDLPATSSDNYVQHLGQNVFFNARNDTNDNSPVSAAAPKVFLAVGSVALQQDWESVFKASALDIADGDKYGLNYGGVLDGTKFKCITYGRIEGVDTSAWPVNTKLYVHPTADGELTDTRPEINARLVAVVKKQDLNDGILFVNTISNVKLDRDTVLFRLNRVELTGQETITSEGTFYDALIGDKGTVPSATETASAPDNSTVPIPQDHITEAFITDTTFFSGTKEAVLTYSVSTLTATEQFFIEIYLTDTAGAPISSANSGLPVGDLGFVPLAFLASSVINTTATNTEFEVNLEGEAPANEVIPAGGRLRFHVLVRKEGAVGPAKTFTLYYGSNYNTYVTGAIKLTTDDVDNASGVAGLTATEAFNTLNGQVTSLDSRVTTAEGDIIANAAAITLLDGRVTQNEIDIVALYGITSTNTANIATNTANIATNTSDIADNTVLAETKVRWFYPYVAGTYPKNWMTREAGWTMITNKQTDDYPAPQLGGFTTPLYQGTISPTSTVTKQLILGQRYTAQGNVGAFVTGYRIYALTGYTYYLYVIRQGGTGTEFLLQFNAVNDGWREISYTPTLIPAGAEFDIIAILKGPDSTPVSTTTNYNYRKPKNFTAPTTGQIVHAENNINQVHVHYTDNDAIDRTALLSALTLGDEMLIDTVLILTIQGVTDNGTYITYDVLPELRYSRQQVLPVVFTSYSTATIDYHVDPGYWGGGVFIVNGLFSSTGSYPDVIVNNDQYIIDIILTEAIISEDWDVVSNDGTGGVGDDTGSGVPEAPIDGNEYARSDGSWVLADHADTYVDSIDWAPLDGNLTLNRAGDITVPLVKNIDGRYVIEADLAQPIGNIAYTNIQNTFQAAQVITVAGASTSYGGSEIVFSGSGASRIKHDGGNALEIEFLTRDSGGTLNTAMVLGGSDSQATLYFSNDVKLATVAGGVAVTGDIELMGNARLYNATGRIDIAVGTGGVGIRVHTDGTAEIKYNSANRIVTTSTGMNFFGDVVSGDDITADHFIGSGEFLTDIPSGALPANVAYTDVENTFTEIQEITPAPVTQTNIGTFSYLLRNDGDVIFKKQTEYWTGSAYSITKGYGIGNLALSNNTGRYSNAFGEEALLNNTGDWSDGFGYLALENNTGTGSTGFGQVALQNNTGNYAVGLGYYAMRFNSGIYSVGIGSKAMLENSGNYSTGIGYNAGAYNTGDSSFFAGYLAGANNTAISTVGIGSNAARYNTGVYSIGIGSYAASNNTGSESYGIGRDSLQFNEGSKIVAMGTFSAEYNKGDSNVALGYGALQYHNSYYVIGLGYQVANRNTSPNSVFMGRYAGGYSTGAIGESVGIGAETLRYNFGFKNNVIGDESFNSAVDSTTFADFVPTDVNAATEQVTITNHGLGDVGDFIIVRYYNLDGDIVAGLADGFLYKLEVIDANTLYFPYRGISNGGTGNHRFTLQEELSYINILGANVQPTRSNQTWIGNDQTQEAYIRGRVILGSVIDDGLTQLQVTGDVKATGIFYGDGSGLTNIGSGSLPANIAYTDYPNVFTEDQTFGSLGTVPTPKLSFKHTYVGTDNITSLYGSHNLLYLEFNNVTTATIKRYRIGPTIFAPNEDLQANLGYTSLRFAVTYSRTVISETTKVSNKLIFDADSGNKPTFTSESSGNYLALTSNLALHGKLVGYNNGSFTTAPRIDFAGSAGIRLESRYGGVTIQNYNSGALTAYFDNTTQKVGIGVAPAEVLHVRGGAVDSFIRIEASQSGLSQGIKFRQSGVYGANIYYTDTAGPDKGLNIDSIFQETPTTAIHIAPAGVTPNVGIGLKQATERLEVAGNIKASGIFYGDGSGLTNLPQSGLPGNIAYTDVDNDFSIGQSIKGVYIGDFNTGADGYVDTDIYNSLRIRSRKTGSYIQLEAADRVIFKTGGTERYRVDNLGDHDFQSGTATFGNEINVRGDAGGRGYFLNVWNESDTFRATLYTDGDWANLVSTNHLKLQSNGELKLEAGSYTRIISKTDEHMYFDAGGTFYFRDYDNSSSNSVTIGSASGNITTIGDITAAEYTSNLVVANGNSFSFERASVQMGRFYTSTTGLLLELRNATENTIEIDGRDGSISITGNTYAERYYLQGTQTRIQSSGMFFSATSSNLLPTAGGTHNLAIGSNSFKWNSIDLNAFTEVTITAPNVEVSGDITANGLTLNSIPTNNTSISALVDDEILSDELIINGTFDTDTEWNKDASWTIGGGIATYDGVTNQHDIEAFNTFLTSGKTYTITFTVVSGTLRLFFGVGALPIVSWGLYSSGTYTISGYNDTGNSAFKIFASNTNGGGSGSIDNVSVREVIQASTGQVQKRTLGDLAFKDGADINLANVAYTDIANVFTETQTIDTGASSGSLILSANQALIRVKRNTYTLGSAGLDIGISSSNEHFIKTLGASDLNFYTNTSTSVFRLKADGNALFHNKLAINAQPTDAYLFVQSDEETAELGRFVNQDGLGVTLHANAPGVNHSYSILTMTGANDYGSTRGIAGTIEGISYSAKYQSYNAVLQFKAKYSSGTVTSSNLFNWSNDSDVKMTMDKDGNLGIGITTPEALLDVKSSNFPVGSFKRITSSSGGALETVAGIASGFSLRTVTGANMTTGFGGGIVLSIQDSTSSSVLTEGIAARIYARRDSGDNEGLLQFFTTGANAISPTMTLRNSGYVGIGTVTPSSDLHIKGTVVGRGYMKLENTVHLTRIDLISATRGGDIIMDGTGGFISGGGLILNADQRVHIMTGNSATMLVTDNKVGIGTGIAVPQAPLDVVSDSSTHGIDIRVRSTNDFGNIRFRSNDGVETLSSIAFDRTGVGTGNLKFYTSNAGLNTARMTITNAGNVGIGTTNPLQKLHTYGTGVIKNTIESSDNQVQVELRGTLGQVFNAVGDLFLTNNDANGAIIFRAGSSTERVRINNVGNVGIGTNTPLHRLHVETATRIYYGQTDLSNSTSVFRLRGNGGSSEILDIHANGNVGIGTITPSADLHIVGDVLIDSVNLTYQENTDVDSAATEVIATVDSATYDAAFFDYVVKDGTNFRAGTVVATHNGVTTVHTDNSTTDIGDTSGVVFSTDISVGNLRLLADTTTDDWTIKVYVRSL